MKTRCDVRGKPFRLAGFARLARSARPALGLALSAALLFLAAGCGKGSRAVEKTRANDPGPVSAEKVDPESTVQPSGAALPPGEGAWAAVTRGPISREHPAIGIFRAPQTTRLGSQVSGRIQDVLVDVGDAVRKGQELVRLDPAFFEIEVAQRQADMEAARVSVASAELDFQRMKNLWEKPEGQEPSVPKKSYDDAKSGLDAAGARLKQAEEAQRHARERLAECTIRAPYDAVVTQRLVDPGEPVTSAPVTHLLELQQVDTLDLEFSLPQLMLSRVGPGTRVSFEVEGIEGSAGSAEISTVFPALQDATRSFRCRVIVRNHEGKLRPGLLVQVRVVDGEAQDALIAPRKAIRKAAEPAPEGSVAFVLDGGKPARREVKTGIESEDRVQVVEGLAEGEQVWVPAETSPQ